MTPAAEAAALPGPEVAASAPDDTYFDPAAETLAVEALRALQLERLQAMVARAYDGSAVYRQLCDEAGVKPADVRRWTTSASCPSSTSTRCATATRPACVSAASTTSSRSTARPGTTGKPTPIWASRLEMDAWALRNAREMWMVGLRPGDLLQNCFGYGLPTSVGLQYGAQRAGIGVVPAGIGRQELLIDLILDLGVTAICTTPSYGLYLADKAKERGLDLAQGLAAARSACSAPSRGRSPAATGSPRPWVWTPSTSSAWASSSAPAWPPSARRRTACTRGPTTCWWSASTRRRATPVPDGAPGELVWTSLTSDTTAMVRYRSHDISSLTWEPCACGRTHPRIGRITGRSDDALSIGGLVVFPSQIEEVLVRFPEFANNFCMVVELVNNLDRLTVQVEVADLAVFTAEEREKLGKRIQAGDQGHGRREPQGGAARPVHPAARHRGPGQVGLPPGGRPPPGLTAAPGAGSPSPAPVLTRTRPDDRPRSRGSRFRAALRPSPATHGLV